MRQSLRLYLLAISFVVTGFLPPSSVWGQGETVEAQAMAALETATADTMARFKRNKDTRFAFTSRIETGNEKVPLVEFSYDPALPVNARYVLIHPSEAENPKARKRILKQRAKALEANGEEGKEDKPDQGLLIEDPKKLLNNTAKFEREDDGKYVFSFQPAPGSVNFGGGHDKDKNKDPSDKKKKAKKKDKKGFSSHLKGEMYINKDAQRLTGVRFYEPKSFKPVPIAKIKSFEIKMDIAPAWEDGPMVPIKQDVTASGKAMFKAFEEHSVVTSSGFEKR